MSEPRYCSLCGCVCVACAQLEDGCKSCELLHPELLQEDPVDNDFFFGTTLSDDLVSCLRDAAKNCGIDYHDLLVDIFPFAIKSFCQMIIEDPSTLPNLV